MKTFFTNPWAKLSELELQHSILRAEYDTLLSQYRALRDLKTPPAPDDGPWQARFAELDREFNLFKADHSASIRENWTSSANFREAKMHLREFLKYMERE